MVNIVALSRAAYRKMIENLVWATATTSRAAAGGGYPGAVGHCPSPAVGALLMSLSTIVVAINAQFLRRQVDFA